MNMLLLNSLTLAQMGFYGGNSFCGGGFMGSPFGILGGILMLVFWVVIIMGIIYLVKHLMRSGTDGLYSQEGQALNILKNRYAKGEISKEDFERMKDDLEKKP